MSRDLPEELRKLQEISPNCGIVYNGKTAKEWYELYCNEAIKCMRLEKQMCTAEKNQERYSDDSLFKPNPQGRV